MATSKEATQSDNNQHAHDRMVHLLSNFIVSVTVVLDMRAWKKVAGGRHDVLHARHVKLW